MDILYTVNVYSLDEWGEIWLELWYNLGKSSIRRLL